MRPVKLIAGTAASLIAVSSAVLPASADNVYEIGGDAGKSIVLAETNNEETPGDNADGIGEEVSDSTAFVSAAVTAAANQTETPPDKTENASAGAPAGIALALAAVAGAVIVVSRRQ